MQKNPLTNRHIRRSHDEILRAPPSMDFQGLHEFKTRCAELQAATLFATKSSLVIIDFMVLVE